MAAQPAGGDPGLPPGAAALKDEGNAAFVAKDYDKAAELYKRGLELCPSGSAVLLSNLAAAHLGAKRWREALDAADACLALDPSFLKAYGRKAAAQLGLIRPADAERTLLEGLRVLPKNDALQAELDRLRQEDDGDQSPRRARDGSDRSIRDKQGRVGLSMSPNYPWPNEAFKAAYLGHEQAFLESFRQEDLHLRATEGRLPLLIVVVSGAQRVRGPGADPNGGLGSDAARGGQHSRVLRRVLEAGARVDGKDFAGFTALHHATAHHCVLDLAEILIEWGADVNLQDRFGTYSLISAVMSAEVASVKMLLAAGARPDLKDNDGCDAIVTCRFHPEIQALIHRAQFSNRRPGEAVACGSCGKANAKKACAGCGGAVSYCNRQCQMTHWPQHRPNCRARAQQQQPQAAGAAGAGQGGGGGSALPREVRLRVAYEEYMTNVNLQSEMARALAGLMQGTMSPDAYAPKPHTEPTTRTADAQRRLLAAAAKRATRERATKVKIQVPIPDPSMQARHPANFLCYNQDRSLMCTLDGYSAEAKQLAALIRQQGVQGLKGYFACYFDDSCMGSDGTPEYVIVSTAMLPAQPF